MMDILIIINVLLSVNYVKDKVNKFDMYIIVENKEMFVFLVKIFK